MRITALFVLLLAASSCATAKKAKKKKAKKRRTGSAGAASSLTYFDDAFDTPRHLVWPDGQDRWRVSNAKGQTGVWKLSPGPWFVKGYKAQNRGLSPSSDHAKHAITAPLARDMRAFAGQNAAAAGGADPELVVQYTVKHAQGEIEASQVGLSDMLKGTFCGGGYIKLLPGGGDPLKFDGDSPYTLMFGPDICGYNEGKVHLIFGVDGKQYHRRDVIKLTAAESSSSDDTFFNDLTHRYTLSLRVRSGRYRVYVDGKRLAAGSIGADYEALTPDMVRDALADTARVGFELWMVRGGSVFDDIYVGGSLAEANRRAKKAAKCHRHTAERKAATKYWDTVQVELREKYDPGTHEEVEGVSRTIRLNEHLGPDGIATIDLEDEDGDGFADDDDDGFVEDDEDSDLLDEEETHWDNGRRVEL